MAKKRKLAIGNVIIKTLRCSNDSMPRKGLEKTCTILKDEYDSSENQTKAVYHQNNFLQHGLIEVTRKLPNTFRPIWI